MPGDPHPDNFSAETFDLAVETVRSIIDAVEPSRTCYRLQTMTTNLPDRGDSHLELIQAVGRERFAVSLCPVDLIWSPRRHYDNGAIIRECFRRLGPHVKACHAKDVHLSRRLSVHLDQVRPGLVALNYRVYGRELAKLEPYF